MRRAVRPFLTLVAMAAVAIGTPAGLEAQKNFEGEVTMTMSMPGMGQSMEMTYLVKGSKMRNEVSMMGMQMTQVLDMETGTMTMLMPAQKAYMKMDMKSIAAEMSDEPPPKITATGNKETIVGHECEYYTVEQSGQSMDVCVAEGMGFFNASSGGSSGMSGMGMAGHEAVWKETFKNGYFPLKMRMSQQGMAMEMTVTKLEEKSVPDSAFELTIPDDYTQMNMPGMGGRGGSGG